MSYTKIGWTHWEWSTFLISRGGQVTKHEWQHHNINPVMYISDARTKSVVLCLFHKHVIIFFCSVQLWTPMGYLISVCSDKYSLEDSAFNSEKFKDLCTFSCITNFFKVIWFNAAFIHFSKAAEMPFQNYTTYLFMLH